jgi:hypothetical protein
LFGFVWRSTTERWEEPMSEPKPTDKPFAISKRLVWEAYQRVKANDGAAGVDDESIEEFERDLKGKPLQTLEPTLVRELFPGTGAGGRDTEAERPRGKNPRDTHRG